MSDRPTRCTIFFINLYQLNSLGTPQMHAKILYAASTQITSWWSKIIYLERAEETLIGIN
jgi:hypothetical protein